MDHGQHFVFKIGMGPIRFYRGDPQDDTPDRYAQTDAREELALQHAFKLIDAAAPHAYFRIIVATTSKGFCTGVWFALTTASAPPQYVWRIPVEEAADVVLLDEVKPQPTVPPRPIVADELEERRKEEAARRAEQEKKRKSDSEPKGA